jgi:hypothetical protein
MAFNQFRINFEFLGKLEVLKDGKDSNGKDIKGTVRDNGKGFTKLVFKGNVENQGDFYLELNGFANPVKFTLNEVDKNGNNKVYDFNGGKLKYAESEIKDLYKSTYKLIKGKDEQVFYHGRDFVNTLIKLIPNIEKNKNTLYKIKGTVDRSIFKNNMYDKYMINSVEILTKKEEQYLKVYEVFAYKREELKGSTITPYEIINLSTKDKGRKDFYYKSNKKLKLNNKWLLNGVMESIPLKENSVIMGYIKDLMANEIGRIKVHYKPVINTTKQEETEYKPDLESLPIDFREVYKRLIEKGLEKQAKEMVKRVGNAIKLSEGGGFKEYYIDEFEYSSDFALKVSETVTKAEFIETNLKNIELATNKETRGKLLLSKIMINKENILSSDENNVFGNDNDNIGFEDNLNMEDDTLKEKEYKEISFDDIEENEDKKEDVVESKVKETKEGVKEDIDDIFKGTSENKDEKVEDKKEETVKENKDVNENKDEEDLFDEIFRS